MSSLHFLMSPVAGMLGVGGMAVERLPEENPPPDPFEPRPLPMLDGLLWSVAIFFGLLGTSLLGFVLCFLYLNP